MPPARRAVIDVGTNSVKLLVAEVRGQNVQPVLEQSEQTRLGRGLYENHILQPTAIRETAEAVANFTALAAQSESVDTRLIATSAAREATNADELIRALHQASRLKVEIISGDQEAEWVFRGVTTDPNLAAQRLLILDVGGGSTEFILGEGNHHLFQKSFPMGSVRLLEKLRPQDPPSIADLAGCRGWLHDVFKQQITPDLEALLRAHGHGNTQLVGTGGAVSILARMEARMEHFDRARIEGTRLTRQQILDWMVHLWSLPLARRKTIIGLPSKRADVILMGVAIYEAVMEHLNLDNLYVSTRGLRFGAVLEGT
jgi:exopolyphosphatase/guanosine-5'-triphosphate,3'-diphosphate pyrophosphatase